MARLTSEFHEDGLWWTWRSLDDAFRCECHGFTVKADAVSKRVGKRLVDMHKVWLWGEIRQYERDEMEMQG